MGGGGREREKREGGREVGGKTKEVRWGEEGSEEWGHALGWVSGLGGKDTPLAAGLQVDPEGLGRGRGDVERGER